MDCHTVPGELKVEAPDEHENPSTPPTPSKTGKRKIKGDDDQNAMDRGSKLDDNDHRKVDGEIATTEDNSNSADSKMELETGRDVEGKNGENENISNGDYYGFDDDDDSLEYGFSHEGGEGGYDTATHGKNNYSNYHDEYSGKLDTKGRVPGVCIYQYNQM